MKVGRFYRLSKTVTKEQAQEIVRELTKWENIKSVGITEDQRYLRIETGDGEYGPVMSFAVNVCSRVAGCELFFDRFDVAELETELCSRMTAV